MYLNYFLSTEWIKIVLSSKVSYLAVFILFSIQIDAQVSCDNSGVPAHTPRDCAQGIFVGANISGRDANTNFLGTASGTDTGNAELVNVIDGFEYCDEDGAATGLSEGPDINISISLPPSKRVSCAAATLSITLRGDFNNSCEVAYIVNECGIIIAQSQVTGLPENDKCDVIFPLDVVIPAADMMEAAADGVINFQIRTPGTPTNTCCQGSQVDATCGGFRGVDCDGNGVDDGNCLAFSSLVWPIVNVAEAGTLNSTNEIVCDGESIDIDVLENLFFDDPLGSGDGDINTGTYHLDFYFGGGPNPPNPYDTNLGGTAGDVINAYDVPGLGSNPQVTIINMGGTGIHDHSNTNAPLASGAGALPSNTLIEVVGSVWVDGDEEPSAEGFCSGDQFNCGDHTNYISFVLLDPIEASFTCGPCQAGPGDDTNIGVVNITGITGGLPSYDNTLYTLQATGGTLSNTTPDVGQNVTLTLAPNQHTWSVTIMDDEGCEFFLSGVCGIEEVPSINMPSYMCVDAGTVPVSVDPAGGSLAGPGVSGLNFNPLVAGVGIHTLTYTITEGTCSTVATQTISVDNCSGCSDCSTPIICNLGYISQNNDWNIDGGANNTLDDGPGSLCGRSIGTTDLCLFNVFIEKCGDITVISKFTDPSESPNDIDVYAWGPFDGLPNCIDDLTPANNIVCNPDVATPDGVPLEITCAEEGKFYIIGVADFTGDGGGNSIFIGQTNTGEPGAGAILGCTTPEPILSVDDVSVCQNEVINLVLRSDNIPYTCGGDVAIYSDPMGATLIGLSGTLTLAPGTYNYYAACQPAAGACECGVDYVPVMIFVDDLVTIPITMDIDDGCGDYDQVTETLLVYDNRFYFRMQMKEVL